MGAISLSFTGTPPAASISPWERVAAGVALAAAAPPLLLVLGAVRVLSGRAPLVAHKRVGLGGSELWVLKVRTMWTSRGRTGGWIEYLQDPPLAPSKTGVDPRVTSRFAAFCRRHSVDELPQLFHVMAGTMRWIGPRPMTRSEVDEYYAGAQREVLSVQPGLTGLWQVMGRNKLTYAQRRRLDLFLVRRFGWRLCMRVALGTVREVLRPRYAW